mgnify:CR=1 FL=1
MEFSENVTSNLESVVGSEAVDVISTNTTEGLLEMIKNEIDKIAPHKKVDTLIVVATEKGNFRSVLALINDIENAEKFFLEDDSQIDDVLKLVDKYGVKKVIVVGDPKLVSALAAKLLLIEELSVDAISTKNIVDKIAERIKEQKEKFIKAREEKKYTADADKLIARIDRLTERIDALSEDLSNFLAQLEAEAEIDEQKNIVKKGKEKYNRVKDVYEKILSDYEDAKNTKEVKTLFDIFEKLKDVENRMKGIHYITGKEFYSSKSSEDAWDFVESMTHREKRSIDDIMNEFMEEIDRFGKFKESMEEKGLLAPECDDLISKANELIEAVKNAYDEGDFDNIEDIMQKARANLRKCYVITMGSLKQDKDKQQMFKEEWEKIKEDSKFVRKVHMCFDRCNLKMDKCHREIGECHHTCDKKTEFCFKEVDMLRRECEENVFEKAGKAVEKCFARCDRLAEKVERASEDDKDFLIEEMNECYERCHLLEDEYRSDAGRNEEDCFREVEKKERECRIHADTCHRSCEERAHGEQRRCDDIMKDCMKMCIGPEFFTSPARALSICDIVCKDMGDLCMVTCKTDILTDGLKAKAKHTCEKKSRKEAEKCMKECRDKCSDIKEECTVEKVCKKIKVYKRDRETGKKIEKEIEICEKERKCRSPEQCLRECRRSCDEDIKRKTFECMSETGVVDERLVDVCANKCLHLVEDNKAAEECMKDCIKNAAKAEKIARECAEKCKDEEESTKCMDKCAKDVFKYLDRKALIVSMAFRRGEELCGMKCSLPKEILEKVGDKIREPEDMQE